MPYKNCENCKKCYPCPVTSVDKSEGAYPITQDTGNVWYCTSCFYCEDICPDYSPRQYAIDKRRKNEQLSKELVEPLEQLKKHGTLFPLSEGIKSYRLGIGLPDFPKADSKVIDYLYNIVIQNEKNAKIIPILKQEIKCSNEYALFLGCLIPYRMFDYELSARNILSKIDIDYCDLPFACCGSIITESQSEDLWLVSAAYNLSLAEMQGIRTIISLCGGCTGNLRRVNQQLKNSSEKLSLVNSYLSKIGMKYMGTINVIHFSEFLLKNEVKSKIVIKLNQVHNNELQKIRIATQVPCQVIRPEKSSPNSELDSKLLAEILVLTNVNYVSYPFETMCCGSSMLLFDEKIAHNIGKKRIDALKKRDVDALVVGCGNCSMNLSIHQPAYSKEKLPILFFTEIVDYALGESNNRLQQLIKKKKK